MRLSSACNARLSITPWVSGRCGEALSTVVAMAVEVFPHDGEVALFFPGIKKTLSSLLLSGLGGQRFDDGDVCE